MSERDAHRMQCLEIWGGNRPVDGAVETTGLDVWVYGRPHGDASEGGDLHFVTSCASGRITRIVVADVSGHGLEVSSIARGLRDLLRAHLNYVDQSRFVQEMNQRFLTDDGTDAFATAVVSTFFAATGQLSVCNAGHPPPVLRRAGEPTWHEVAFRGPEPASVSGEPANIPLGILPRIDYREVRLPLGVDDLVLCTTDAVTEARDADGRMLGADGLRTMLDELGPVPADAVIPGLLLALEAGGYDLDDDVTLLLMAATGRPTRLIDNVLAPFRVVSNQLAVRRQRRGPRD